MGALTNWNFSTGHLVGAAVMLVVVVVAGVAVCRWLNRPFSNLPSRREWAEYRRQQDAHWDQVYREGRR